MPIECLTCLLSGVRGKVEDQNSQEGDAHAGNDEVDGVEEGLAAHRNVKRDVQVRFITASIILLVPG